ncbi:purple acid phosphatase family protein [Isoalcanivorax beigongshangi]|uniref:Purple acid phosphatase family protein n=1 Tax=Isoalcanivorax beigongshangi TaxID=3238810 RepID=A0ABV4AE13_9GAMM
MDGNFTRRALVRGILFGIASMALSGCGGSGRTEANTGAGCPPQVGGGAQPPRGVHASWTNNDVHGTRTLTWFTDGATAPESVVEYGPVLDGMDACALDSEPFPHQVAAAHHATYGVEVRTHVATLTGLQAGVAVRYRVGSDAGGWSPVRVLQATRHGDFRFCHFGDQGLGAASERVMHSVAAAAPDFYLIAGDVAYADGHQPVWDQYFDFQQPYAAHIPLMTCPGNHENKDGKGQGYLTRFSQPGNNAWYGFDYNRVHFFFSTGGSLLKDLSSGLALSEELVAMEQDLAEAWQRRRDGEIDFIVVVQHYTIWTNNKGRSPGNIGLITLQEQILLRYDVDLLLVGHDHIYERSHPMKRGLKAEGGYVQLTQGGGGRRLYELIARPASWAAVSKVCHGYSVLEKVGRQLQVRSYAVSDADGNLLPAGADQLIDQFVLSPRVAPALQGRRSLAPEQRPPRSWDQFGVDLEVLTRDTVERNLLHDLDEIAGP